MRAALAETLGARDIDRARFAPVKTLRGELTPQPLALSAVRVHARVPLEVAREEEGDRCAECKQNRQHPVPGRRDVHVHDPLRVALVEVGRHDRRRRPFGLGAARVEFLGYVDSGMMGTPENDAPNSFWTTDVESAGTTVTVELPPIKLPLP